MATGMFARSISKRSKEALEERPAFTTTFKPRDQIIVDDKKERRFEEWKRKNYERIKASNIKPKVYEYSRPPQVIKDMSRQKAVKDGERTQSTAAAKHSSSKANSRSRAAISGHIRRLSPLRAKDGNSGGNAANTTRRKRLTKTRHREKSTPILKQMYETSSEEDGSNNRHYSEDSGIGSSGRSDTRPPAAAVATTHATTTTLLLQGKQAHMAKPTSRKKQQVEARVVEKRRRAAVEEATKELVAEVVELSVCEVRQEEEHLGALCGGGQTGEQQQVLLAH